MNANACLERLEREFTERGIQYEVLDHPPAYTAQEVAAAGHISGYHVIKAVIAMADGRPVVLALQAPREVDLDALRTALRASEVRLAREEEFSPLFPDCEVGAMPPLPGVSGLPVYADQGVLESPQVVFEAGSHGSAVRLSLDGYLQVAQPRVMDFARRPASDQPPRMRRPRRRAWPRIAATLAGGAAVAGAGRLATAAVRRRPVPAAMLAGAAMGVAGAALLDPHAGRRRRALVRDKGRRYLRLMRRSTRGTVRRATDRTRGMAAEMAGQRHRPEAA